MLVELRAENYAVIDHAIAVFGPGLNLLTGETGAGKSILVDALALLMGGKSLGRSGPPRRRKSRRRLRLRVHARRRSHPRRKRHRLPKAPKSSCAAKSSPPARAASSSTTSPPPSPFSSSLRRSWRSSTRRLRPSPASTRPSSASCSTASAASRPTPSPKPTRAGAPPPTNSTICSRASRTACAWSICGATSARRSKPRISKPAKTRPSKPKSACWPTPKSSTPPPWAPSTSSTKAAHPPRLLCAPRCATSRSWPATTRASLKPAQQLAVGPRHRRRRRRHACATTPKRINASPERLAEIEDRLALLDRLKRKYGKTVAEVIAFGEDVARKLAEVEDRDEILKTLRAAARTSRGTAYRKAAGALTAERQRRRRQSSPSWPKRRSTRWP